MAIAPIASICGLVDISAIFDLLPGILALDSIIIFSSLKFWKLQSKENFPKNLGLVLKPSLSLNFYQYLKFRIALSVSPTLKNTHLLFYFSLKNTFYFTYFNKSTIIFINSCNNSRLQFFQLFLCILPLYFLLQIF